MTSGLDIVLNCNITYDTFGGELSKLFGGSVPDGGGRTCIKKEEEPVQPRSHKYNNNNNISVLKTFGRCGPGRTSKSYPKKECGQRRVGAGRMQWVTLRGNDRLGNFLTVSPSLLSFLSYSHA